MSEGKLRFDDDKLYSCTPLPQYGDEIYETHLIITKEVFQECYKKWIAPQENIEAEMTGEEAIEWLEDDIKKLWNTPQCNLHKEALNMAIEALKSEPKTGHWIMPVQDDGMSDPIYYQVRCSKCGFDLDPQTWHMELHQYDADKYCPKCGSAMKGE